MRSKAFAPGAMSIVIASIVGAGVNWWIHKDTPVASLLEPTCASTNTPEPAPMVAPELTPASESTELYFWEGDDPCFDGYPEPAYTNSDIEILARTIWGEARGCSQDEQRLVVWTVLQRVDADGWGDTIEAVVTTKRQFAGYQASHPIDPDIYALCAEVLVGWWHGARPLTHELYAPTAPYYYFDGIEGHNWFREEWR